MAGFHIQLPTLRASTGINTNRRGGDVWSKCINFFSLCNNDLNTLHLISHKAIHGFVRKNQMVAISPYMYGDIWPPFDFLAKRSKRAWQKMALSQRSVRATFFGETRLYVLSPGEAISYPHLVLG